MMKKLLALLFVALLAFTAACSGDSNESSGSTEKKGEIIFGDSQFNSLTFNDDLAAFIIKHGYGIDSTTMPGSSQSVLQGIRNGDMDVYMEAWTGSFGDAYKEAIDSGEAVELGVNYDDNIQGLYVPTYMIKGDPERGIEATAPDLKSWKDLPKYWELFKDPEDPSKGRIVGSPTGWYAAEILDKKMKEYNLYDTYNYFYPGSDTALSTSIVRAYEEGEPWVGYYWEPTAIMGRYDMTFLEDPNLGKWDSQKVTIIANETFPKEYPGVTEFLKNYHLNTEIINNGLNIMDKNDGDTDAAIKWFLTEHEELWTKWVPDDVAKKVKDAM